MNINPIKKKNYKKAIVFSRILDNGTLLIVDSDTNIIFLNKETLEITKIIEMEIQHPRYKSSVVSISSDGNSFASLSSDYKESTLYNTNTKNIIATVNRHQGDVSCIGIDPKNRYMFSCGDDGKTFVIDIESGELAFILPVHKDIVYDIAFSDDAKWLATASYDKTISLFYLPMKIPKHMLIAHSEPVKKLCFLSQNRLFSIDKSNSAIIWDMYEPKVITRLEGIHDEVTCVTKSYDSRFLFLATELGYILLYELENYQLLSSSYIKLSSSITSLEFYENNQQLIIGTKSGDLLIYNIFYGENNLKILLKKKDFVAIEELIELNPLLVYTKAYEVISLIWDQTLEKAKEYLDNNDKNSAVKLFAGYIKVASKNKIIQELFKEYEKYEKLNALVRDGKISLAYGLVNSDPIYLNSKTYLELENQWIKVLKLAKRYSIHPKGEAKMEELLAPYRGISDKTQDIHDVISQHDVYMRFVSSIIKKDYKLSSELIKQHPFLKKVPEHKELIDYSDSLYIDSQKLINEGNFTEAMKLLNILEDFSDFEEIVKKSILDIQKKEKQ